MPTSAAEAPARARRAPSCARSGTAGGHRALSAARARSGVAPSPPPTRVPSARGAHHGRGVPRPLARLPQRRGRRVVVRRSRCLSRKLRLVARPPRRRRGGAHGRHLQQPAAVAVTAVHSPATGPPSAAPLWLPQSAGVFDSGGRLPAPLPSAREMHREMRAHDVKAMRGNSETTRCAVRAHHHHAFLHRVGRGHPAAAAAVSAAPSCARLHASLARSRHVVRARA